MRDFSSFSFIFIGDTHGFLDDFLKQKEIISRADPEYVLSEQLQDLVLDSQEKYAAVLREKKISEMVAFRDVERLLRLCATRGIKLIGLDLPHFGLDATLMPVVKGQRSPSRKNHERIESILRKRQAHHLALIERYSKRTKKPLVILLGAGHLSEDSLLMRSLSNYLMIYPRGEKGEVLTQPPKEGVIIAYGERTKNA